MHNLVLHEAGVSIWLIIGVIFWIFQLITKKDKNKKKQNNVPTFEGERENDSRPGKTIAEILQELENNINPAPTSKPAEKSIVVASDNTEKKPSKYEQFEGQVELRRDGRVIEKRKVREYKSIEFKKVGDRSKEEHSALKHKEYNIGDGNFDSVEQFLDDVNHGDFTHGNDTPAAYNLNQVRDGFIMQTILERPEF